MNRRRHKKLMQITIDELGTETLSDTTNIGLAELKLETLPAKPEHTKTKRGNKQKTFIEYRPEDLVIEIPNISPNQPN